MEQKLLRKKLRKPIYVIGIDKCNKVFDVSEHVFKNFSDNLEPFAFGSMHGAKRCLGVYKKYANLTNEDAAIYQVTKNNIFKV